MSNRFLAYTNTYVGPQGTTMLVEEGVTRNISVYQYLLFRNRENSKDRTGVPVSESPRVFVRIKHVKICFSAEYGLYKKYRTQTFGFPTKYSIVCFCSKQDITKNTIYWNDIITLPQNVCYVKSTNIGRFTDTRYEPNQQNPTYIYDFFHPDVFVADFDTDVVLNPGEEFVFNVKISVDFPSPLQGSFNQIFISGRSEHGVNYEIDFN